MNIKPLKRMLKGELLKRKTFSLKDSIFIISSPRGGSTWLGEIFNAIPNTIINWEPFHPKFGVLPKKFNGGDAIYFHEEEESNVLKRLLEDILNFKRFSSFTLSFCAFRKIIQSKIVITKSVRTTCLIPWIVRHIPLGRKPIYLLRHPIPTSFSHIKAFTNRDNLLDNFKAPVVLNNLRYVQHEAYINSLNSKIEKQIAIWCLNNLPVINHSDHDKKWIVAYYENIVLHPEEEIKKIFEALGLSFDSEFIKNIKFRKPSQTDRGQDLLSSGKSQIEKWQAWLTQSEKESIQEIFNHFGLKVYSAFDAQPHIINLNQIEC